MRNTLLIFDQEHFKVTGVYTFVEKAKGRKIDRFYSFRSALEAKEFVDMYWINETAARFAYYTRNTRQLLVDYG